MGSGPPWKSDLPSPLGGSPEDAPPTKKQLIRQNIKQGGSRNSFGGSWWSNLWNHRFCFGWGSTFTCHKAGRLCWLLWIVAPHCLICKKFAYPNSACCSVSTLMECRDINQATGIGAGTNQHHFFVCCSVLLGA